MDTQGNAMIQVTVQPKKKSVFFWAAIVVSFALHIGFIIGINELTMVIQADTQVSHGRVIHFVDQARKVGIFKYAFNVDPVAAANAPAKAEEELAQQETSDDLS